MKLQRARSFDFVAVASDIHVESGLVGILLIEEVFIAAFQVDSPCASVHKEGLWMWVALTIVKYALKHVPAEERD